MRRSVLLCVLFLLSFAAASAQFPQTLRLDATAPTIIASAPTRAGWQYTITVTGTYSMWPPYDSYGVDGAYVYDVPDEEVQAFRWPPEIIYPIPHWVGDTLEVPPFTIPGMEFKFRTRDNIGFRYNGQPLPDRGLSSAHRYRTTIVGDGTPIEFQILDSAFSLREGKIIPRYEDNSGALTILVEERPLFNLCDVETFCAGGSTHLAIAASLMSYDDSTGRPTNILKDPSQLAVVVDGQVLEADSISCGSRTPVAYALVLDRSGSMKFPYDGASDRMSALKRAAHGFLRTMKKNDQAMLVTFSFDDDITLDVTWTSDTARLGRGIDAIEPLGGTAWRDAAWVGLDNASRHYHPLKAVVLLTDGDDTHSKRALEQVVAKARAVNVPVFAIGMALVDSSERPLRYLATQSNGRFFQARDQRAIDSAFNALSRVIESEECCTLYVRLPKSVTATAGMKQFEIVARDSAGMTALRTHEIYVSDSCSGVSAVPAIASRGASLSVSPNPVRGTAIVTVAIEHAGIVAVELVAADGRVETIASHAEQVAGSRPYAFDTGSFPSGVYVVRLMLDGVESARERIVIVR
jgi:Mg-chelatase subunit ChlD